MSFRRSALAVVFWRAVRLSVPLTLAACGPSRVTPVYEGELECNLSPNPCFAEYSIEVRTELPPGTLLDRGECDEVCKSAMCRSWRKGCVVNPRELDGGASVTCGALSDLGPCVTPGRPVPEWHQQAQPCSTAPQFFAQMARAEAESVAEFERIAIELELHGAPTALISRARQAALEERRHAAVTAQLAHDKVPEVPAPPKLLRSLEQLAEANLLEGCINETMSAVLVAAQAEHAPSAEARHQLEGIAREELSHAEFSWELHEWLVSQLDTTALRSLSNAATARIAQTIRNPVQRLPEDARLEAGLPDVNTAQAKARLLADELWTPALAALSA